MSGILLFGFILGAPHFWKLPYIRYLPRSTHAKSTLGQPIIWEYADLLGSLNLLVEWHTDDSANRVNSKPWVVGRSGIHISYSQHCVWMDIGFYLGTILWSLLASLSRIHVLWVYQKLTVAHIYMAPSFVVDAPYSATYDLLGSSKLLHENVASRPLRIQV